MGTLPFLCLLGSIVVVGCLLFVCSWSAGGNVMLGVVPTWDRFFLFLFFFWGGRLFGGGWV